MAEPAQIVASARGWIGTPYLHQASVKMAGADCLGLLRGVWREVIGAEPERVPAYSPDWSEVSQHEALAEAVARWLAPKAVATEACGDVVLFRMRHNSVAKHLGVISATGAQAAFIHSYSGHGVVETALSDPWRRRIYARFQFPKGA